MADTSFVNGVTVTDASWFNDVNRLHYTILGNPANVSTVAATLNRIPSNPQVTTYTLVAGDAGKCLVHSSTDNVKRVFILPANSTVAFPVDTVISFANMASSHTVNISSLFDTVRLAGSGNTSSRLLASYGLAAMFKTQSTEWIISGTGVS